MRNAKAFPKDSPFLLDGNPAGTCEGCGAVTDQYHQMFSTTHGVWMCEKCTAPAVLATYLLPPPSSSGNDIRNITAAHTGGHVEWPRIQTVDVSVATSAVQEVEWAKERLQSYIRPSRIKGPDGIYRCPECGCHEGEVHTGSCLERRLEEKAKQGIYAALADLRSHGADMRVRISRLRWIPKYTPKAEPVAAAVSRRRMTFRDFMHKMVNAIGDFFWMAV